MSVIRRHAGAENAFCYAVSAVNLGGESPVSERVCLTRR